MLDIISDGRLNLGAARGGTVQEMSLCGVDPELTHGAGGGGAPVHRALLARGHDPVGLRAAHDPAPARAAAAHRRAPSGAAPPPAAVPRVHQPRHGAARGTVRRRARWCSASVDPRPSAKMRPMFDDERAQRDPDAVVSPGHINDEFVALCPTFLMDDRDEAFRIGTPRAPVLRRGDHPLGGAQRRGADARHRHRRQRRVHGRAPARWPRCRRSREGEAPPTAASSMYNTDHALGDADTAIAYVRAAAGRPASTT